MTNYSTTIWTRHWGERLYSLTRLWKAEHQGVEYWNGSDVWEDYYHDGYTGWHACSYNYGIGYDVVPTYCTAGRYSNYEIEMWYDWDIHFINRGVPISQSHNMHVNLYSGGGIYLHDGEWSL